MNDKHLLLEALRPTPEKLARRYKAGGFWDGITLPNGVAGAFESHRANRVRVHSQLRPYSGSLGEVLDAGRGLARNLRDRGIGVGDIVAFQLPNWAESLVCFTGITLSGATLMPIAPYYGTKELRYILQRSQARAFVVADRFRGRDHRAECEALRSELPALDLIALVGDQTVPAWATRFTDLVSGDRIESPTVVDPEYPAALAWTSGTTGSPKGVLLSHRALMCEVRDHMADSLPAGPPRLAGVPLAHVTGMLATALVPPYRGDDIHLVDVWDPEVVLTTMSREGLPPALYAPVFATSLLNHPECSAEHIALMDTASLGGSPVSSGLVERLHGAGITVTRGYGCTEHPSISLSTANSPLPQRHTTDGRLLPGVEVRLVDDGDQDVSDGNPGEVLSRGPDMFSGYLDPANNDTAFHGEGWYRTGDIAIREECAGGSWLRIVDRKKDIVIRSGINISTAEVENTLADLPGAIELAAIGVPDERTGERLCVVVRRQPDTEIHLDDIRRQLASAGMAKQKWPEELVVTDEDLPRTSSGKIRKAELRDRVLGRAAR